MTPATRCRRDQGLDKQLCLEHVARPDQEVAPQVGVGAVADVEVDVGGLEVQAEGPLPGDEIEALVVGEGVVAVEKVWMVELVGLVTEGVPGVEVVREVVVDEQKGHGPDEDEGDEDDADDRAPLVPVRRLDLLLGPY